MATSRTDVATLFCLQPFPHVKPIGPSMGRVVQSTPIKYRELRQTLVIHPTATTVALLIVRQLGKHFTSEARTVTSVYRIALVRGLPVRLSFLRPDHQPTVTSFSAAFPMRPKYLSQAQHFSSPSPFQMSGPSNITVLQRKNPDDVVITMAIRSPLCKAKKGGFRDMR